MIAEHATSLLESDAVELTSKETNKLLVIVVAYFRIALRQKCISGLGTDSISLYTHRVLLFLIIHLGRPLQKSLTLRRFKSDRDDVWQYYFSSK